MRLSVFGLDHSGAVMAGCLASRGHEVIAVDENPDRIELIRGGRAPVYEPRLDDLVRDAVAAGRLAATTNVAEAVADSVLSSICIGTPAPARAGDVLPVAAICEKIGLALRDKDRFHSVVLRVALPAGTTRNVLIPILQRASGKALGSGFGVAVYPAFLRRGRAVDDYATPPAMLLGVSDDETLARLREMDIALEAPEVIVDLAEAEAMTRLDHRSPAGPAAEPRRFAAHPLLPGMAAGTIG